MPSTRRRFSMRRDLGSVGASSVSLALYLDTVLQFGILTLLLASTSVYSLVKNVTDDAFTSMYEVPGMGGVAGADDDDDDGLRLYFARTARAAHESRVEVRDSAVAEFL